MLTKTETKGSKSYKLAPLKWNWYLIALKVAMGALLVLLIVLLLHLRQNEANEQRSTLIADVLWLEQSASFHLELSSSQFEQLARELAVERGKKELFDLRGHAIMQNNPDIQQIVWLDASGKAVASIPAPEQQRLGVKGLGSESQKLAIEMASKIGKTTYTDAYHTVEGTQFEVYSPIFVSGQYQGTLVGVYSFSTLLKQLVPWWFAEKYQVRILDSSGNTLASKSRVGNALTTINYSIPFEPPGYGMVLQVDAYPPKGDNAQRLLTTIVIALTAAVLLSLWRMRGHVQRRIAAEQALRKEHAFRKAMEDSLTIGMRARNLNGLITYVNPAFCQMVGFTEEELINARPPMPYWAPEEMDRTLELHDSVVSGKKPMPEGYEIRFMRKDGSRFDALIYDAPLIDADGQHTGWMSSVIDVTARKHAEELARQQQEKMQSTSRLVTMGELASSLAHELNQPLAAITSYNAGCLNRLESGTFPHEEFKAALEKLGVQARRAGHIIRRVHDFVRKSEPKLAPCNPIEVVEDSIGFIEADAKLHNVRIVRKLPSLPVQLLADRVMLEQVMLNLMRNAIEAMSSDTTHERRRLTISVNQLDDQLEIRVADRGPGISPSIREKLFSPFFSTKNEGMGMGLNICRSIIEFHRGRLWVEDNPKGGTIFGILLPITMI